MATTLKNSSTNSVNPLDRGLLIVLIFLIGIGLVQVYSTSSIFATETRGDGLFFFKRQAAFCVLALIAMLSASQVPMAWIERFGFTLWMVAGGLLVLTFVPGITHQAGGAARWLQLPLGLRFEPAELLKVSLPLLLATFFSDQSGWVSRLPIFVKVVVLALPLSLLLFQPDFGSFVICILVTFAILFVFGLRWSYIGGGVLVSALGFYFLVMNVPYRRARVMSFLDPWQDPARGGFQVIQSLLSYHAGGLTGVGIGQGQGKLFFLPEAHTDFTLAVLGEETGFVGFSIILLLYFYLMFRGLQIGMHAKNVFGRVLVLGLTVAFSLQVFINMGVTLGLLPPKGLTLPFLSYGGSSLVLMAFAFGLILNVERQST